jgi:hypothetical protein
MFQENLGTKFDVCSIFKPNSTLAKVVEDLRKLSKDLTKQDHTVGGTGNSLNKIIIIIIVALVAVESAR